MKVLALNGSPRPIGNTSNILHEVADMFEREGIEVETVYLYEYQFVNCNVCLTCDIRGDGRCIDEDDKEGMKGVRSMVEGMVSAIMRLNGYA